MSATKSTSNRKRVAKTKVTSARSKIDIAAQRRKELEQLARKHGTKPFNSKKVRKRFPSLFDEKLWNGFDEWFRKLRGRDDVESTMDCSSQEGPPEMLKSKLKSKPKRNKKVPSDEDIYKGIDPELARIGRAHNAKPMKSIYSLHVPGVLDHKTADEIDADIRKMRER